MSKYYFKEDETSFNYLSEVLKEYIDILTKGGLEEITLLPISGFTPGRIADIFDELGYSKEWLDENGWEQDTWYLFSKDDIHIQLYYCGYDFEMVLSLYEGDE